MGATPTHFDQLEKNKRFVALALEASVYHKGRHHGLTLDELLRVGRKPPLNYNKGGIVDAIKSFDGTYVVGDGSDDSPYRLSSGQWEFLRFQLGIFLPREYRPAHADLDFPIQHLLYLCDTVGEAEANATRDEIILAARSNNLGVDVAIEMLLFLNLLRVNAVGRIALTMSGKASRRPSELFPEGATYAREDMPVIYEHVRAVLQERDTQPTRGTTPPAPDPAAAPVRSPDLPSSQSSPAPVEGATDRLRPSPRTRIRLTCLIISPGDVDDERDAVGDGIAAFNARFGEAFGVMVEAIRWEIHGTPAMGDTPQALLNRQFVNDCDMGIAIFWTRLGTPTATHASGSVDEIANLMRRDAPLTVYFSDKEAPPSKIDAEQFAKLKELRSQYQQKGLLGTFTSCAELRGHVPLVLASHVARLVGGGAVLAARPGFLSSPPPDVRVRVDSVSMLASPPNATPGPVKMTVAESFVRIQVENHSPSSVFLTGPSFGLADGHRRISEKDSTGAVVVAKRELRSGDSTEYLYSVPAVDAILGGDPPADVLVHDAVQRRFRAPDGSLAAAIESARAKISR